MHPLDGAYIRLDRAKEQLAELKSLGAGVINAEMESIRNTLEMNPNIQPSIEFRFWQTLETIPPMFALPIRETIYNLRASLDCLVYELAIVDSGSPQKNTQFPIEDTQKGFGGRRKSYLKFVNDAHAAAIERLQPNNGVVWTRWMRKVSNPDKHRHLLFTPQAYNTRVRSGPAPKTTRSPDAEGVIVTLPYWTSTSQPMHMELHVTPLVTFDDGMPVIDPLKELVAEVAQVLADFKPEF